MIPFHKLYSWLFKSFNISGETLLIERLIGEGHSRYMILKRSWIFGLFMLWMPICIIILGGVSIYIAYTSIAIPEIQYTLIGGNVIMSMILIFSSFSYIHHFKGIHSEPEIIKDAIKLRDDLALGDKYFQSFFNWSITNQWILFGIIIAEIILIFLYGKRIGEHFWFLLSDTLVILIEIGLLRKFRKRMMDLEMDYNVFVPGKIFFVNQSGILSTIQTIDGDKVKTVQSIFPSKIASFFNYGTVHVLTEGDTAMIGTMNMYYVTNPDKAVANIQELISLEAEIKIDNTKINKTKETDRYSIDTREKIRDVLR